MPQHNIDNMQRYPQKKKGWTNPDQPYSTGSVKYLHIPTVEEARNFFGPIAAEERAWRDDVYFNELLRSPRSRLGIGEHDRAEAYIFGNGVFPESDKQAHTRHFPVSVKVIQIDELFIAPYEMIDLSAYADEFPWNVGEAEMYLHLTINRMILSAGSKLRVRGNICILNCQEAVANNIGNDQAIIELCGSSSVQHHISTRITRSKKTETNGSNGLDGEPLKQESTALGPRICEGSDANNGQKGTDGNSGMDGSAGPNGAMLFLADIRFRQLAGFDKNSIRLKAGAAQGFPGGNGDDGGNAGNGGNGASGAITTFGIINGCRGGDGGRGGNGGSGGRGGSGGLACDVFVSVPHQKSPVFQVETLDAPGGKGGEGGKGGKAGIGGIHGRFYTDESGRTTASDGEDGSGGMRGADGKTRKAPKVHIYEQPETNNKLFIS